MIISASRRTDIPACHFAWFMDRLQKGSVDVPNPRNAKMVRHVGLSREEADLFVFWTKNPLPMEDAVMDPDSLLNQYPYYFQFTLTPYGRDIEPFLPDKSGLIRAFQRLSGAVGSHRMIWRYDPVLLSPVYGMEYHKMEFAYFCSQLSCYTNTCVISFLDAYRCMQKAMKSVGGRPPDMPEAYELAGSMVQTAAKYGIRLQTCAETMDFSQLGIEHGACIDGELAGRLVSEKRMQSGRTAAAPESRISLFPDVPPVFPRAKGQRGACRCAESVDIGSYDTCTNGCLYCYANRGRRQIFPQLSPGQDPQPV